MTRQSIVSGERQNGDEAVLNRLRPQLLSEYVGQKMVLENLRIAIEAARGRNEPLDHVLLHGPPGLGKTTLAHVIATEMGAEIITTSGPALERAADLVGILTNLHDGEVLFIDEIHRLPRVVEEYLYPAMEDFEIDFVLDPGPHARTVKLNLAHFTIVGATTRAGLLTGPLRNRFGLSLHLDFYDIPELTRIVTRSAGILGMSIEEEASSIVAARSRGTPRVANRLLRRVRDFAQVTGRDSIDADSAIEAMEINGVDEFGLDVLDRKYLEIVIENYSCGPVGISALAATLNEEQDTLMDVVEPYLLSEGFIIRTSRGRCATAKACRHLGLAWTGRPDFFEEESQE
ncbi:MAG TPA: Holliday junction branch migration DNA helicase RuvB [Candidatus Fermentibacter daniensis]|jgi:Holliday junction DNA helicase RuvB|nr:Holliday junction branch migration DNA helicase RuvB [Candidatus Fermentibacter daniensis]HOD18983.1 Holliday junction branch migration DNA helicase RuvB [Candidatus Fermentibacter daniensis]HOF65912.1 Holliday junction branch migration DNA helicase RuvB [Candidatus Fermentibacter daniensis]HOR06919.1 Holliday junction branch migration DNA helicase RuvB [Candidatus Fermentibacter daniensis]HPK51148.1 Holliday junction branch migration DNA helicase RuvB [Candidatus Fermentibacter daniensis]